MLFVDLNQSADRGKDRESLRLKTKLRRYHRKHYRMLNYWQTGKRQETEDRSSTSNLTSDSDRKKRKKWLRDNVQTNGSEFSRRLKT